MFTKIRTKLIVLFLPISIIPLALTLSFEYYEAKKVMERTAEEHLVSVRDMKKIRIEQYFSKIKNEAQFFAKSKTIKEAMKAFSESFFMQTDEARTALMRQQLHYYYQDVFSKQLPPQPELNQLIKQLTPYDPLTVYYQYHYISNRGEATDLSAYARTHQMYHPELSQFMQSFGYYDVMLVENKTGYVVYSNIKEVDFGTSLISGVYANNNVGIVFNELRSSNNSEEVKLIDFEIYLPSYQYPVSFLACPIYDDEVKIGTLMLKLSIDEIDGIMTGNAHWQEEGLGRTGECYIIGSDFKMRSDSRFLLENEEKYFASKEIAEIQPQAITMMKQHHTSILFQEIKTQAVKDALEGNKKSSIGLGYTGEQVFSTFTRLQIPDVNWIIVSEMAYQEIFQAVDDFKHRSILLIIAICAAITIGTLAVSMSIAKPINDLLTGVSAIARGNLATRVRVSTKDEIGRLTMDFNQMAAAIQAQQEEILLQNVSLAQQKEEIEAQRDELEKNEQALEKAYHDIQSSINYAKRIQQAILPDWTMIEHYLPKSFILFQPRDVVSGDFYWFASIDSTEKITEEQRFLTPLNPDKLIIIAADCTGHGVPGAFMSLIGIDSINSIVHQQRVFSPEIILERLHLSIRNLLRQDTSENRDGMDIAVCVLNRNRQGKITDIEFAGAKNSIIYIKNGEVHQIKGDKFPIGGKQNEVQRLFTKHIIPIDSPTAFYLASDGYEDQFGGNDNSKFMIKRLRELLLNIHLQPYDQQKEILLDTFQQWKGKYNQLDDVMIAGFGV
jgi:serine phosphatase RsbU (regulator of sigma subunit)